MIRKALHYLTHWENWHWFFKYIVIGPAWLWNCCKAGSFWFFTPSNPTITFGGFTGETKREIYAQLPPGTYPKSIYISPFDCFANVRKMIDDRALTFPMAVKPDVGMMGFMFRKVTSLHDLEQYHEAMTVDYIIQEFIHYPVEVSVFYYRFPDQTEGKITGFVRKEYLEVVGDGEHTLKELIMRYPRAQFRLSELFSKHEGRLHQIIRKGERYCLSEALNLSRGGRLVSMEHEKDQKLLALFDYLSHYSGKFYYGRYDIRCASIDDLKERKNFSILEFNGSGAEPHHVYGNGNSFIKACRILIDHWSILYKISQINRSKGIARWRHRDGIVFLKKAKAHFKHLQRLDLAFEFKTQPVFTVNPSLPVRAYSTDVVVESNSIAS